MQLTDQDIRKYFPAYSGEVEIAHEYLVCGKANKPPVILLHELPGLETKTLDYAAKLSDDFTVYVPILLGEIYQDSAILGFWEYFWGGEWDKQNDLSGSTIVTQWLRKFTAKIAKEHSNQPVSIIGNCLTGALPLALLDNQQVTRIVLAQPTLPMRTLLGLGGETELAISNKEWGLAKSRLNPEYKPNRSAIAYGTRFELDGKAPIEKYNYLVGELQEGFKRKQIGKHEYETCKISSNAHSSLIGEWKEQCHSQLESVMHPSEIRRREIVRFLKGESIENFKDY